MVKPTYKWVFVLNNVPSKSTAITTGTPPVKFLVVVDKFIECVHCHKLITIEFLLARFYTIQTITSARLFYFRGILKFIQRNMNIIVFNFCCPYCTIPIFLVTYNKVNITINHSLLSPSYPHRRCIQRIDLLLQ